MNYAGFWIRFVAYLVDSLIVGVGFVAVVMLLGMMGLELFSPEIIFLAFSIFYWALMHSSKRQATLGKSLVGLKVGGPNGERLSVGRALAREVAKILSTLTLLIGYILAAFTKRKQALHDMVASTVVVRDAPGRVVVALAIAALVLLAPFAAGFMFGLGALSGMVPGELMVLLSEPPPQKPKPPAAPTAAAQPQPQVQSAAAPAAPAASAAPATPAAPAKPEPAKPAAAEPAKPTAAPATAAPAKPAAEPVKVAAAPAAKEAEKPAPPPAEPVKRAATKPKPPPAELTTAEPAAAEEAASTADSAAPVVAAAPAAPRKVAAREPAPQFSTKPAPSDPRFNDLVTAVLYRDAKAVEDLIMLGKWADKADSGGMTPLMLAVTLGDAPIAETLLKAGANPNQPGPAGATAVSLARERNDAAMLGLLQRYGRVGP
jgi:uncharacterized RDD family membrane protein YckC